MRRCGQISTTKPAQCSSASTLLGHRPRRRTSARCCIVPTCSLRRCQTQSAPSCTGPPMGPLDATLCVILEGRSVKTVLPLKLSVSPGFVPTIQSRRRGRIAGRDERPTWLAGFPYSWAQRPLLFLSDSSRQAAVTATLPEREPRQRVLPQAHQLLLTRKSLAKLCRSSRLPSDRAHCHTHSQRAGMFAVR